MCQVMGVEMPAKTPIVLDYDEGCPAHYKGDGYITCSRALKSMTSCITGMTAIQGWWLMCAFKYVWRCLLKGQTLSDIDKAIDCLQKLRAEVEPEYSESYRTTAIHQGNRTE